MHARIHSSRKYNRHTIVAVRLAATTAARLVLDCQDTIQFCIVEAHSSFSPAIFAFTCMLRCVSCDCDITGVISWLLMLSPSNGLTCLLAVCPRAHRTSLDIIPHFRHSSHFLYLRYQSLVILPASRLHSLHVHSSLHSSVQQILGYLQCFLDLFHLSFSHLCWPAFMIFGFITSLHVHIHSFGGFAEKCIQ